MDNKKRGTYLSDIDILKAVVKSNNVRECLLSLYENKNPSNSHYKKVSRLMIENGIRFKDGSIYVHPSLEALYNEKKDLKPIIRIVYE